MSDQWMYQAFGQDFGPISFSELQELAAVGTITADSEVRSLSDCSWQRASHVKGLQFEEASHRSSAPTSKAASDPEMTTKGVDEWYCRIGGLELGPLTFDELLDLAKTEQVSADDDVRLGGSGKWRRVGSIGRLMAALPYQSPESRNSVTNTSSRKPSKRPAASDEATSEATELMESFLAGPTSVEPGSVEPSPAVTAPPVDPQAAFQLAYEQARQVIAASIMTQAEATYKSAEASAKSEIAWALAANVDRQWWGWMGNVEFGPIEFPQVFALAKNGQLKPTDFIRNGAFGQFVPSSSLPGLFSAVAKIAKAAEALALAQAQAKAAVEAAISIPLPVAPSAPPPQAFVETPKRRSPTPPQEITIPMVKFDQRDSEPVAKSSVPRTTGRSGRDTPAEPIGIRSESGVQVSRASTRSRAAAAAAAGPATIPLPETEDEILRRVEECLETLNIPSNPRIGYEMNDRVVTVRGSLTSEGERLLVLRRVGAVPGVVRVVDSLTVAQAERPVPAAIPAAAYRPVPLKKNAPRSSGPGLFDRFKESVTGEHRNHAIAITLAALVLGYWFYPRGPVRPVAVHPVKGRVIIDGEPLANAAIVLHRVGKQKSKLPANMFPRGKALPDGTFALETFDPADGAPDGEFVATVFLVEEKVESDGERSFGPNLLPAVYSKPESSPFKVTITSATKELQPMELTRR